MVEQPVTMELSWQARAAAKVAATLAHIPEAWLVSEKDRRRAQERTNLTGKFMESLLSTNEVAITALDASSLIRKLASGTLKSRDVANAYCKAAAIAHQINNCLHEVFFDQALRRASELDEYLQVHGEPMGPLHGLPVSLKDQFHVPGIDTTMGYVGWIDTFEGHSDSQKVHKVQSQVVSELLQQGAIIYCKTSLPQTLMYGETINNIIGQTLNPVNQRLSCGGSSGGEGALLALKASLVGLGTDIGGSVRIPAAFCGTYSLKPTHNRLSYRQVANTNPGQLNYASTVGVMGRSLDSVKLVTSAILSTEPWLRDPLVVPIPWRRDLELAVLSRAGPEGERTDKLPLKIGMLFNDGFMTPHPPITRGLSIVQKSLVEAGHNVVSWNPPSHHDAAEIHLRFLQSDGGHDIQTQLDLSGEPLIGPLREIFKLVPPISAIDLQELAIRGRDACEAYLDYWDSMSSDDGQPVDAFVMPVAPHAAVIPSRYLYTGYTEVVNLLDFSAAVIPVTTAQKSVDIADPEYIPLNDLDEKNWKWYDAEVYDGAPVGLQIVCKQYEEEKAWAIAKVVDAVLQNRAST